MHLFDTNSIRDFSQAFSVQGVQEKVLQELEKAEPSKHTNILIVGSYHEDAEKLCRVVFNEKFFNSTEKMKLSSGIVLYQVDRYPIRIYSAQFPAIQPRKQKSKSLQIFNHLKGHIRLGKEAVDKETLQVVDNLKNLVWKNLKTVDPDQYIHAIWFYFDADFLKNDDQNPVMQMLHQLCIPGNLDIPVIAVLSNTMSGKSTPDLSSTLENEFLQSELFSGCCTVHQVNDSFEVSELETLVRKTLVLLPETIKKPFTKTQKVSVDLKVAESKNILKKYTASALATGASPVPGTDAPLLIINEIAMCVHITSVFGLELDKTTISGLITTLIGIPSATIVGKSIVSNTLKLIPGAGTITGGLVGGSTAALITAALGMVYISVLEKLAHGELNPEDIKSELFKKQLGEMLKLELLQNHKKK